MDVACATCGAKVAFKDSERELTYEGLRFESFNIANSIYNVAVHKAPVLIVEEASVRCASMAYGVLYSGNYYTICNPEIRKEGIADILDSFSPSIILTSYKHRGYIEKNVNKDIKVLLYEDCVADDNAVSAFCNRQLLPQDPAFVVYTSGSSGVPKGVIISNQAVGNFICAYKEYLKIDFDLRIAEVNANMFVIFSLQIFAVVALKGMEYIFSTNEMFLNRYLKKVDSEKLNTMFCISSVMSLGAKQNVFENVSASNFKRIMFVGAFLPNEHLRYWMQSLEHTQFIHAYGSTESLLPIACIVEKDLLENEKIPFSMNDQIGVELLILDENQHPVNEREVGELYIRSNRTATGYYKDCSLTERYFIQNPMHTKYKDVVYKSGDLAYRDKAGNFYLVGRNDSMVKRRGYRIELSEIDTTAYHFSGVQECVSLYDATEDIIVFYYEGEVGEDAVLVCFQQNLATYKIPDRIIRLDRMPHNANGKIDQYQLSQMETKKC